MTPHYALYENDPHQRLPVFHKVGQSQSSGGPERYSNDSTLIAQERYGDDCDYDINASFTHHRNDMHDDYHNNNNRSRSNSSNNNKMSQVGRSLRNLASLPV